jgi:PTH2 family peptidyl-tRNA hydrolase
MSLEVKQVIILRNDLKLRKGKAAVQAAHASLKAYLTLQSRGQWEVINGWWANGQTKICLKVGSEEELIFVYKKSLSIPAPLALITDAAKTELKEPTRTALAIGPWWADDINPITQDLELM